MSLDNRLLLAKYLYIKASDLIKAGGYFDTGLGVSLLQDSVEIALLACASTAGASPKERSGFHELWNEVNRALTSNNKSPLTMKIEMVAVNQARVNVKHIGQMPNMTVAHTSRRDVGEFLARIVRDYFSLAFESLSLASFVLEEKEREQLELALKKLNDDDLRGALTACAAALDGVEGRGVVLVDRSILVQMPPVDHNVRQFVNNEIVALRRQIWGVQSLLIANICGVSADEFLLVREILRSVTASSDPRANLDMVSKETVLRCIDFIAQYSIGLTHRLSAPQRYLGEFGWSYN